MTPEKIALLAHAMAWIAGQETMDRAQMVKVLQYGSRLTAEQADGVIVYGLAHALLVEDPTNATRLQGAPRPTPKR